jgi:hypothetical protein
MSAESNRISWSSAPRTEPEVILEFITFDDPRIVRSGTNIRRIRSQAMRHVHRQQGTRATRPNEIELDISRLLPQYMSVCHAELAPENVESQARNGTRPPSVMDALSSFRFDPFSHYPINMGLRQRQLYEHCEWIGIPAPH